MDYVSFYQEISAQKQIDKLAKKYNNKRIVIYGAGIMSNLLFKNYNLKELNIIAICDKKFGADCNEKYFGYPTISPEELKVYNCDVILVLVKTFSKIAEYIKYDLLINTINEDVEVRVFVKPSWSTCIKELIF